MTVTLCPRFLAASPRTRLNFLSIADIYRFTVSMPDKLKQRRTQ
jgi:hypothetical protein